MKNKIVICISGKMRSGKNQFADYLSEIIKEKYNLSQRMCMFAGDLKVGAFEDFQRMIKEFKKEYFRLKETLEFNITPDDLGLGWLNVTEDQFYNDKTLFTRALLQIYGTDIFCKRVDTDYWAKRVLSKAEECEEDIIIVTDTRFPNELSLLHSSNLFKTISIRLDRDTGIKCDHPSEIALDQYREWDFIIDNNGDLEQLKDAAELVIDMIIEEENGKIDLNNFFDIQDKLKIKFDPIFGSKIIFK